MWISGVKCTETSPVPPPPLAHMHTHTQSSSVKYWVGISHDVFSNTKGKNTSAQSAAAKLLSNTSEKRRSLELEDKVDKNYPP